jgi:carboxypeptidase family protein/TonB-dependent receptor-like protein
LRLRALCYSAFLIFLFIHSSRAQSPNGTISGIVTDPTGAAIAGAEILVVNDLTRVQYSGKTNEEGIYLVSNLPPGPYRVQVSKFGFKTIIKPDITLNVQDALALNFALPLGAISEVVTIQGGAPLVNTESASVGTVIDWQFVGNLPLNGRSFNTLLQLTPGAVIARSSATSPGQFSISGQRSSANDFTVDGVSANFGVAPTAVLGASGTGSSQAFSAVGGTSSLVSVEALQEFRVETSSFAPEFGHLPGGHVVLTTRSGANDWHGGLYEYFRNDVLDANDWFADRAGKDRAPERHNDFGGFLGGPIRKEKTFFFLSYEGARLRLPLTSILIVPSLAARAAAPAGVASVLNAYPQPNGPISADGQTAQFTGVASNSATLNAGSVRIDHHFSDRFSLFGRYNEAPSDFVSLGQSPNDPQTTQVDTRTLTLGLDMSLTPRLANSLRGNYSRQRSAGAYQLTSAAGSTPYDPTVLLGSLSPEDVNLTFGTFDISFLIVGPVATNRNSQLELADDASLSKGRHQLKFGVDHRGYYLDTAQPQNTLEYLSFSLAGLNSSSSADIFAAIASVPSKLFSRSLSLYAQDNWKATPRLTVTYGLRWEFSPSPSARGNTTLAAWKNVNDPPSIALAPSGTPLWESTYSNFAPRLGLAWVLTEKRDLVLRVGGGTFYDLGVGASANLPSGFPNTALSILFGVPIPVGNINPLLPAISENPPYQGIVNAISPQLSLPRSYQWNAALEKSFRDSQAVTVTYVGQAGRNLLRTEGLGRPNANFAGTFYLTNNSASSDYHALQFQYRRPLAKRVQALLNYTFSHSLDNASNDTVDFVSSSVISAANDRGPSDFDVRHSLSGAVTVTLPTPAREKVLRVLLENWSVDSVVVARSGFPFNGQIQRAVEGSQPRPNRDPSQPVWANSSSAPGGKSLNPLAFSIPLAGVQGSEGRNDIRGFGLTQVDLSLARKFAITDRVNAQFRTDAFNLLNHPNFTNPLALIGSNPIFLASRAMLNQGLGGLSPLFQQGGPRSLQLSLKLTF